jgi:hypothetical protein
VDISQLPYVPLPLASQEAIAATPSPSFMYIDVYYYFSNLLMIYLQSSICIYVIIRLQQEASARSGNANLRAPKFSSDDQPLAAKKITEHFDIRFSNLPRPVVEVRHPGSRI